MPLGKKCEREYALMCSEIKLKQTLTTHLNWYDNGWIVIVFLLN